MLPKDLSMPFMLNLNGRGSHMSLNLIDSPIGNGIILYILFSTPHNTLQPVDISVHKQLESHFSNITDFITLVSVTHGATRVTVNKANVPILFKEVFEKLMSMKTIISGFPISGICPSTPKLYLKERLMPSDDATVTVNLVQQATHS